jgi:hypothetical protein
LHQRDVLFCGTIRGNEPYLFERLNLSKRLSNEYFACRSRAEHLWRACKSFRDKGCARTAYEKYVEGEKDEHRLTVHGLSFLRDLDREIDAISPSGRQLFPQRIAPRYFRLRDANSVRPCWSSHRLGRLTDLSGRRHHGQDWRRHCRGALDRLRSHRASGWFDFGHGR